MLTHCSLADAAYADLERQNAQMTSQKRHEKSWTHEKSTVNKYPGVSVLDIEHATKFVSEPKESKHIYIHVEESQ